MAHSGIFMKGNVISPHVISFFSNKNNPKIQVPFFVPFRTGDQEGEGLSGQENYLIKESLKKKRKLILSRLRGYRLTTLNLRTLYLGLYLLLHV